MRLISPLLVSVTLILYYDRFVWCNKSTEVVGVFNDFRKCDGGYCVPLRMCKNGSIDIHNNEIKFNEDLIYVDLDDRKDSCQEFLLQCCAVKEGVPTKLETQIQKYPLPKNGSVINIKSLPPTCGHVYRTTENGTGQSGAFPWMAALLQRQTDLGVETSKYLCGGSLIHPQVVLTAAHCIKNYTKALNTLVVRLGEWETVSKNASLKHVTLGVRKIIMHENYMDQLVYNNLGLLILDRQVSLNEHINLVCLPNTGENFDNQRCMVPGWDKDNFNTAVEYSPVPHKIELPMIPQKKCSQLYRASFGPFFHFHQSFMCAGDGAGVDICKVDGGSPLACQRNGTFVQAGIIARQIGCGRANVPGTYVKLSDFVDWIKKKMAAEIM